MSTERQPTRLRDALAVVILPLAVASFASCAAGDGPPATAVLEVADTVGDIITRDPYRWLEQTGTEDVEKWVAAQNEWTDGVMELLPGRQAIARRIVELLRTDLVTQPLQRGNRYFFMRRSPDDARFAIFLREGADGVDRRLIDPHTIGDSLPPAISLLSVTPDGGIIAYSVQRAGSEQSEVSLFDVQRRTDVGARLPAARYTSVDVVPDGSGVYFARLEDDGPRLHFRSVPSPGTADSIVFGDGLGPDRLIGATVSTNGRWLVIVVFHPGTGTSEVHIADLAGDRAIRPVTRGIQASFLPVIAGDTMLLQTDWEAPGGRVMRISLEDPRRERWVEVVPEREDAMIEGITAAGGRIIVNSIRNASSQLDIYDLAGTHVGEVSLPWPGTVAGITGGWERPDAFFTYATFHVPATIERLEMTTLETTPWFEPTVPAPGRLTVRQDSATSADGTQVPVWLVHRDDIVLDGRHVAVLTGFGGFGVSLTPDFVAEAVITAERGGVFAVAVARGGGEFGDAWHLAAVRDDKPRAIDDFIAVAEWLIDQGYTVRGRLAAYATSHGGMLITAAMTQRPGLFAAVAAQYPLLDMGRLDHDAGESASGWIEEYGSPAEPAALAALLGYSPYEAVASGVRYPPVLLISARTSTIPPFHARKMIARLQAGGAEGGPFLLREDTLPFVNPVRFAPVENLADALTFLFGTMTTTATVGPGPISLRR